ncbi:DMT family transporter [Caldimonas tepidiphila]|uniref:DMT family transporter n=1 Tax=Caldimonas tepidiphila TaxID=2315841 RepID=UPI003AF40536
MRPLHVIALTAVAMLAFAGNSLLCRLALKATAIDAASFTAIRLVSGALVLALIVRLRAGGQRPLGDWGSAAALFAYAAAFSYAYLSLSAGTGALLLFGAVQATMIGWGLWRGERLGGWQWLGLGTAAAGLVWLLLPGLAAPPWQGATLMVAAGIAWGIYSLRGRGAGDATCVTAGNFLRAALLGLALGAITLPWASLDAAGAGYAVASGAVASGMGYAVWYTALRGLKATTAATMQLSVPVLAALGGVLFLAEPLTARLGLSTAAVIGGIALVILMKKPAAGAAPAAAAGVQPASRP